MSFLHFYLSFFAVCFASFCYAGETLHLIDNLRKAQPGDFIVTSQNKTYSILHIREKNDESIAVEEITASASQLSKARLSRNEWVAQGASCHSSRLIYVINTRRGILDKTYALTQHGWSEVSLRTNILSTLLNLELHLIPTEQRRRVGGGLLAKPRSQRPLWQPELIYEGSRVSGVPFNAWKAVWPKDGSELSGMSIEAYLPQENSGYPSYFPYWLQINGNVVCSKIRIIDAGKGFPSAPASSTSFR